MQAEQALRKQVQQDMDRVTTQLAEERSAVAQLQQWLAAAQQVGLSE